MREKGGGNLWTISILKKKRLELEVERERKKGREIWGKLYRDSIGRMKGKKGSGSPLGGGVSEPVACSKNNNEKREREPER